jgi:hypothetical protein
MSHSSSRWLLAGSQAVFTGLFCSALLFSSPARAEFSMLAGVFDGGEAGSSEFFCHVPGYSSSQQSVEFTVSADGIYRLYNPFSSWDWWDGDLPGIGLDSEFYIYEGSVNGDDELADYLGYQGSRWWEVELPLKASAAYTLIVHLPCYHREPAAGTWLAVFKGEGQVLSSARREIPDFMTGRFDSNTPRARGQCGRASEKNEVQYRQIGPIRVSRDGLHYLASASPFDEASTCQAVYTAPFNPANVAANLIDNSINKGGFKGYAQQWGIELKAGTDYWLVIQPAAQSTIAGDEFMFVLAPPAPVRINPAMTGLWADSNTPGQGIYLDVFNSIDSVFMAWFTYDLQLPGAGARAVLGDPGHRWLTGLGSISGNSSDIQAVGTSGGQFNAPSPALSRVASGTVQLQFDSCTTGRAIYELGDPSLSGVVHLQRPFEDAQDIALCERFLQGPGVPGPL